MLHFFVCVVFFLLARDRKRKNYECDCLGNSIPYKCLFQTPRVKTVEEDAFLVAKMQFFRGGEKLIIT